MANCTCPRTACDCAQPVAPGSNLDHITRGVARELATYCSTHGCSQSDVLSRLSRVPAPSPHSKRNSRVVSTRLPHEMLKALDRTARKLGCSRGEYVRRSLSQLAAGQAKDPASLFASLAADLGLPPGATPGDVIVALQDIAEQIGAPAAPAPLSPGQIAACRKAGIAPDVFRSRRSKVSVRRV
jgi:hypothetical protein